MKFVCRDWNSCCLSVCWRYGEDGVEINDELLDGDVDDELDEVDKLCGETFESKACFAFNSDLNLLDLRKKLPFPNISPAFG